MPGLPLPACHSGYVREDLSPNAENGSHPIPISHERLAQPNRQRPGA